jgi:hypothetical protein
MDRSCKVGSRREIAVVESGIIVGGLNIEGEVGDDDDEGF